MTSFDHHTLPLVVEMTAQRILHDGVRAVLLKAAKEVVVIRVFDTVHFDTSTNFVAPVALVELNRPANANREQTQ